MKVKLIHKNKSLNEGAFTPYKKIKTSMSDVKTTAREETIKILKASVCNTIKSEVVALCKELIPTYNDLNLDMFNINLTRVLIENNSIIAVIPVVWPNPETSYAYFELSGGMYDIYNLYDSLQSKIDNFVEEYSKESTILNYFNDVIVKFELDFSYFREVLDNKYDLEDFKIEYININDWNNFKKLLYNKTIATRWMSLITPEFSDDLIELKDVFDIIKCDKFMLSLAVPYRTIVSINDSKPGDGRNIKSIRNALSSLPAGVDVELHAYNSNSIENKVFSDDLLKDLFGMTYDELMEEENNQSGYEIRLRSICFTTPVPNDKKDFQITTVLSQNNVK